MASSYILNIYRLKYSIDIVGIIITSILQILTSTQKLAIVLILLVSLG